MKCFLVCEKGNSAEILTGFKKYVIWNFFHSGFSLSQDKRGGKFLKKYLLLFTLFFIYYILYFFPDGNLNRSGAI